MEGVPSSVLLQVSLTIVGSLVSFLLVSTNLGLLLSYLSEVALKLVTALTLVTGSILSPAVPVTCSPRAPSLTSLPNPWFLLPVSEIKESLTGRKREGVGKGGGTAVEEEESRGCDGFSTDWCDRHY